LNFAPESAVFGNNSPGIGPAFTLPNLGLDLIAI
jgi:hypothetical protein